MQKVGKTVNKPRYQSLMISNKKWFSILINNWIILIKIKYKGNFISNR